MQQTIGIGTVSNDGQGDPIRTAFRKINENFTELYGASPGLSLGSNVIINSGFNFWQRGTSFSASGYTADRWKLTLGTGNTVGVSQLTTDLDALPSRNKNAVRISRTVAGSGATLFEQPVEFVRRFSGQTVCLSFWAKTAGNPITLKAIVAQNFGSGGSTSVNSEVRSVLISSSSWARYYMSIPVPSVLGKTIGTSDYISPTFYVDASDGVFILDLADIQLELGTSPSAYKPPSLGCDMYDCLRFYERFGPAAMGRWTSATRFVLAYVYFTPKRATPSSATVITQVWSGARLGIADVSGTSLAITTTNMLSAVGCSLTVDVNNVSATAGEMVALYSTNFAIDCEL